AACEIPWESGPSGPATSADSSSVVGIPAPTHCSLFRIMSNKPKIRFMEKGERKGEDVYIALGQTDAGRYLAILFIYKGTKEALILSARDMAPKERRQYGKK